MDMRQWQGIDGVHQVCNRGGGRQASPWEEVVKRAEDTCCMVSSFEARGAQGGGGGGGGGGGTGRRV